MAAGTPDVVGSSDFSFCQDALLVRTPHQIFRHSGSTRWKQWLVQSPAEEELLRFWVFHAGSIILSTVIQRDWSTTIQKRTVVNHRVLTWLIIQNHADEHMLPVYGVIMLLFALKDCIASRAFIMFTCSKQLAHSLLWLFPITAPTKSSVPLGKRNAKYKEHHSLRKPRMKKGKEYEPNYLCAILHLVKSLVVEETSTTCFRSLQVVSILVLSCKQHVHGVHTW